MMEPTKPLGSGVEMKSRLDGAQCLGILVPAGSISGIRSVGGATINSEEFLKFQVEQDWFAAG